jgi:glycosyltransferase involved in cell wall biosynthesis
VTGAPAVSVLVPVLNEEAYLERALDLMLAQTVPGGVEVLCVDGGSTDRTRAILDARAAADPRVRVFDNPAQRTPQALNIALRHARGAYVARMDAHTWYPADYLEHGVRRLERGDVAWVSGPQIAEGEGTWSRRIARALQTPLGIGGAKFRTAQDELEVDSGFTGVWRRATVEAQGGWDEGWPINQDGELAARIRADGGKIVCIPEMAASYVPRDSLRKLARQYWRYGQYRVKTSVRHPQSMRRSHVLAPGFALTVLAALVPSPLRALARLGAGAWLLAAGATSVREAMRGASPADAASLPLVLATMHLAWGLGFLYGCVRFGVPTTALARVLRP